MTLASYYWIKIPPELQKHSNSQQCRIYIQMAHAKIYNFVYKVLIGSFRLEMCRYYSIPFRLDAQMLVW